MGRSCAIARGSAPAGAVAPPMRLQGPTSLCRADHAARDPPLVWEALLLQEGLRRAVSPSGRISGVTALVLGERIHR